MRRICKNTSIVCCQDERTAQFYQLRQSEELDVISACVSMKPLGLVSSNVVCLTKAPKLANKEIAILSKSEIARLKNRPLLGKGAIFQAPKTKNSIRRVLLMPEVVENLRAYKEWQKNYSNELSDLFARHNPVFTGPFGEPISSTNFSRKYFKPLLKKCKISSDFTIHGLRHTHATLLLRQGVNPKIFQERLGHSSIKVMPDTYSHVLPDMQKQAVEALQGIFQ